MGTSKPFKTGSESEVRCEADTFETVENPPGAAIRNQLPVNNIQ
jgi:hypothetical protein